MLNLQHTEWIAVDAFVTLLAPMRTATIVLQGMDRPTTSQVSVLIRQISSSLQPSGDDDETFAALRANLRSNFQVRLASFLAPTSATFMDPRFKRGSVITESTVSSIRTQLEETALPLMQNPDSVQEPALVLTDAKRARLVRI